MKYIYSQLALIMIICLCGCKKYVTADPPLTNPSSGSVYTRDAEAAAVLTSIYGKMAGGPNFAQGNAGISLYTGLSADELQAYSQSGTDYTNLYTNSNLAQSGNLWQQLYQQIYVANAALEGLAASNRLTDSVKRQLTGEAKFMRAFLHFYLVNLFGDVPLVLTTDYRANAVVTRTAKADVYTQIIKDLTDAQQLLPDNFVTPLGATTTERVRPNKSAATALLARVYLYTGDWVKAEEQATVIINNTAKYTLTTLAGAFLKNSKEAIWQVQSTSLSYNTFDGYTFIRSAAPSADEPVSLPAVFLSNFETGDQRRQKWVDSITINAVKYYQPAKYRVKGGGASTPVTEYFTIIRLAEIYLIRAEARAQLNKITESRDDLLAIRRRAGLLDATLTANDKASLLIAVAHERQVELFTEWGHRWFDLKRTGTIDAVMSVVTPLKGGTWNTNMQLYPIPKTEIALNPRLSQNPGY